MSPVIGLTPMTGGWECELSVSAVWPTQSHINVRAILTWIVQNTVYDKDWILQRLCSATAKSSRRLRKSDSQVKSRLARFLSEQSTIVCPRRGCDSMRLTRSYTHSITHLTKMPGVWTLSRQTCTTLYFPDQPYFGKWSAIFHVFRNLVFTT